MGKKEKKERRRAGEQCGKRKGGGRSEQRMQGNMGRFDHSWSRKDTEG